MDKQQILNEIRRMTSASGGKVPGIQRFQSETGIGKSSWYPVYWFRWSDAIREAELQPNSLSSAFSTDFLIIKYVDLIRELGRFPIEGELEIKRKRDKTFPNRQTFYNNLGSKAERAKKILVYCRDRLDCADIVSSCSEVLSSSSQDTSNLLHENHVVGYVYLVKHGSRREYKIGKTLNPIRREGEIALQLPEKLEPIHYIKTDDPSGIEKYWHTRFAEKRKGGEWFTLTAVDVQTFKRWRKIY